MKNYDEIKENVYFLCKDEDVLNAGIPNMPLFIDMVCVSKPFKGKERVLRTPPCSVEWKRLSIVKRGTKFKGDISSNHKKINGRG